VVLTTSPDARARISIGAIAREHPDQVFLRTPTSVITASDLASRLGQVDDASIALGDGVSARALGGDVSSVLSVLRAFEGLVTLVALHPRWTDEEGRRKLAVLGDRRADELRGRQPDATFVAFTSGTSGDSAAVVHTGRSIAAAAIASLDRLELGSGGRFLLSMPLAHVGGASIVARCLAARSEIVLDPSDGSFDARRWNEAARAMDVTHASIVPTMLKRIVDSRLAPPSSLRKLIVGGAACDSELAREAIGQGYPVVRTYGMTETFAMVACEAFPGEGGVGRPLPDCDVRVVDGELRIRAGSIAAEIVPGRSLALDDEGFLRTRDAGSIDASGSLHVHGRTDDVVITGGENVHPAEVEAVLLAIDGVEGVVVFGEPDPLWGEVVVAAYVGGPDASSLAASVRDRLSGHARPKRYVRLAALPTLPSGKVDRVAVRSLVR